MSVEELHENGFIILQIDNEELLKQFEIMNDNLYNHIKKKDHEENKISWIKHDVDDVAFEKALVAEYHEDNLVYSLRKHNSSRYDISEVDTTYSNGYINNLMYNVLNSYNIKPIIENYLENCSFPLRYDGGILPVEGIENAGVWHRDTYEMFKNVHSTSLPAFYINCLFWINDDHNAPTLLYSKSHKDSRTIEEITQNKEYTIIYPKKGQLLIFDGRIVHKGDAGGKLNAIRKLVYHTIYPFWYYEPTF